MRRGLETDPRGHRASPRPYQQRVLARAGPDHVARWGSSAPRCSSQAGALVRVVAFD